MNAAGQMFDGYYYFGGENGVLLQEEGETPEGFSVAKSGKFETKDLGMCKLSQCGDGYYLYFSFIFLLFWLL